VCEKKGAACESLERRYANDTALNLNFFRIMEKIAVLILTCVKLLHWIQLNLFFLIIFYLKIILKIKNVLLIKK
jgi:hypothetical protein